MKHKKALSFCAILAAVFFVIFGYNQYGKVLANPVTTETVETKDTTQTTDTSQTKESDVETSESTAATATDAVDEKKEIKESVVTKQIKENIKESTRAAIRAKQAQEIKDKLVIKSVDLSSDDANSVTVSWKPCKQMTSCNINLFTENGSHVSTKTITDIDETSISFNDIPDDTTYVASVQSFFTDEHSSYKSESVYSDSYYLEHIPTPQELALSGQGSAGRLVIPDVGINVGLHYTYGTDDSQSVVNSPDAAAIPTWFSQCIIADHWNQGFEGIKSCVPGQTLAYVGEGDNVTTDLVDDNYNSITTANMGGLTMYTCNDNWRNITIVFFQPY